MKLRSAIALSLLSLSCARPSAPAPDSQAGTAEPHAVGEASRGSPSSTPPQLVDYLVIDEVDTHDALDSAPAHEEQRIRCASTTALDASGSRTVQLDCRGTDGAEGAAILPSSSPSFTDRVEPDEDPACTSVRHREGAALCVERRCSVEMFYGDSLERWCLDAAGLSELRTKNVGGPRVTTWTRLPRPSAR
jgi:hypothetical protein